MEKIKIMKKYCLVLFGSLFLVSCSDSSLSCDCEYVVYDSDPTNNYVWTETYRSTWDSSCVDERLDESTYTDSDGDPWYSRTEIECN